MTQQPSPSPSSSPSSTPSLLQQKQALRQQAKQSLLKQCYKMAMNKYLRLISMGGQGFTARQWSVIHLNTAISMQYQDQLQNALDKVNQSIKIDPTYQKAYYRRLQILDELQEYQLVLHDNIVPGFIKNAEIQKLRQEILHKYRSNIGFDVLVNKIWDKQFVGKLGSQVKANKFVEESLSSIFMRICNLIEHSDKQVQTEQRQPCIEQLKNTGKQLVQFYKKLMDKCMETSDKCMETNVDANTNNNNKKQEGKQQTKTKIWLQFLYQNMYKLCIRFMFEEEHTQNNKIVLLQIIFRKFWKLFASVQLAHIQNKQTFQKWYKTDQYNPYPKKLLSLCPLYKTHFTTLLHILESFTQQLQTAALKPIRSQLIKNMTKILHSNIKYANKINSNQYVKLEQQQGSLAEEGDVQRCRGIVLRWIGAILKNAGLEDWGHIDAVVGLLITFYEQVDKNGKYQLESSSEFQSLYITTHKLTSSLTHPNQQLQILTLQKIHKIFIKAVQQKHLPTLNQLYLCYRSLQNIKLSQIRHSKQYENLQLQQFLFAVIVDPNNLQLVLNSLHATLSKIKEKQSKDRSLLKYLILLNLMGVLNPAFVIKLLQQNKQNVSSGASKESNVNVSNMFVKVLEALCQMEKVIQILESPTDNKQYCISIYLQALSLFSLSDIGLLNKILAQPLAISSLYLQLSNPSQSPESPISSTYSLSTRIKFLYTLTTDTLSQRQQQYADKMGVSIQEIRKVKKLQGQYQQHYLETLRQIQQKREVFINVIMSRYDSKEEGNNSWRAVLQDMVTNIGQNSNQNNKDSSQQNKTQRNMLVGIILRLSQKQASKFYSPQIIKFMLHQFSTHSKSPQSLPQQHKLCYNPCLFFSQICKKCNPQIFAYAQLQQIANSQLYLIENGKHQLHIFQAYLSLINLSSKKIRIPLKYVQTGLMEQNQYIVHAALELMNNVLVNMEEGDTEAKHIQRLGVIAQKYYRFYRNFIQQQMKQSVLSDHKVPISNYSHPYRIYMTAISLMMVLQALTDKKPSKYQIKQMQDWKSCSQVLKHLSKNNADVSLTLFKLVLHHFDQKTLPNKWSIGLETAIEKLKIIDKEKWMKIAKYIN